MVEIVDPAHRLYGYALPLMRITTHARLGHLCVVSLYPGIECFVPLAATSLGGALPHGKSNPREVVASPIM